VGGIGSCLRSAAFTEVGCGFLIVLYSHSRFSLLCNIDVKGKGKAVPLQAWSGPTFSGKLRFPDFMTTAQDGGKVVSLKHRPSLPPGITPGYLFLLEAESTPGP
jgi:hypothetical protein